MKGMKKRRERNKG
jgi:hypothetical protein